MRFSTFLKMKTLNNIPAYPEQFATFTGLFPISSVHLDLTFTSPDAGALQEGTAILKLITTIDRSKVSVYYQIFSDILIR